MFATGPKTIAKIFSIDGASVWRRTYGEQLITSAAHRCCCRIIDVISAILRRELAPRCRTSALPSSG